MPCGTPVGSILPVTHHYNATQARTHVYDYYKQVSRRRHQYGDPQAMSLISLTPSDHVGAIPAYKAGLDAVMLGVDKTLEDIDNAVQEEERKARSRPHQLPPLATAVARDGRDIEGQKREASGDDTETKDGDIVDHHVSVGVARSLFRSVLIRRQCL